MHAIIIAVGDELISGETVDGNSAFLSRKLSEIGIPVVKHITVGDDVQEIAGALSASANAADIVIATGGLGPTSDDLTRHGLAAAMHAELACDEASLRTIEEFFAARGRAMIEGNKIQAYIPERAVALPNEHGTAPGIFAEVKDARVFVLPGVPAEMRSMFAEQVAPRLPPGTQVIFERLVHVFGAGESNVAAKIEDCMARDANPLVGITVKAGMITLRVKTRAGTDHDAEKLEAPVLKRIRERLGELVVGEGDDTLVSVTGALLRERGQTVGTAESCTGGLLGTLFTDVAGSSDYYRGGVVAYSNDVKASRLCVKPETLERFGAVSEEVASEMAAGLKQLFNVDWALSTTGIAGPGGGTREKPVGLVCFACAGPGGVATSRHIFPGPRGIVRRRSAFTAINALRLSLCAET